MGLPLGVHGHLHDLVATGGGRLQLPGELDDLLTLAVRAVPSCLGVSLTLVRDGLPVTVTALTQAALLDPVRASLALRLPARPAPGGSTTGSRATAGGGGLLVLFAGAVRAWAQPAADLAAVLDLDPRRVTVDGHLELPALATAADVLAAQLDDVAAVDRALGVLLDRGLLPDDGRRELNRLADVDGTTVAAAAHTVLAGLP